MSIAPDFELILSLPPVINICIWSAEPASGAKPPARRLACKAPTAGAFFRNGERGKQANYSSSSLQPKYPPPKKNHYSQNTKRKSLQSKKSLQPNYKKITTAKIQKESHYSQKKHKKHNSQNTKRKSLQPKKVTTAKKRAKMHKKNKFV